MRRALVGRAFVARMVCPAHLCFHVKRSLVMAQHITKKLVESSGSLGGRSRAPVAGMRKYECQDCGFKMMVRPGEIRSFSSCKVHCRECGSTFLEPCSRNALKDSLESMHGKAERDALAERRNS